MSARQNITLHHERRCVRVRYDRDWREWYVRLYVDGQQQHGATYHTDDHADAVDTAWVMLGVPAAQSAALH